MQGDHTYFVSASAYQKQFLLQSHRMARLLIDVLYHYRKEERFLLHAFVVMPNHVHLILTPSPGTTLERAMQLIKGNFSFRAKKDLGLTCSIWQPGYFDYRIRGEEDFNDRREYIHQNPVRAHLAERAEDFPFSSAHPCYVLDDIPQWLKPHSLERPLTRH